jgi:hypothetical protein
MKEQTMGGIITQPLRTVAGFGSTSPLTALNEPTGTIITWCRSTATPLRRD